MKVPLPEVSSLAHIMFRSELMLKPDNTFEKSLSCSNWEMTVVKERPFAAFKIDLKMLILFKAPPHTAQPTP